MTWRFKLELSRSLGKEKCISENFQEIEEYFYSPGVKLCEPLPLDHPLVLVVQWWMESTPYFWRISRSILGSLLELFVAPLDCCWLFLHFYFGGKKLWNYEINYICNKDPIFTISYIKSFLGAILRIAIRHITTKNTTLTTMNPLQSYLDGIIIRSEMMENMLYQYICFQNMHQSCTWIRYIHTVGSLRRLRPRKNVQHFDELMDDYFL